MPKIKKHIVLIIFIAICLGAGGLGSIFTTSAIPTWYAALVKPSFSPPNWIFAPVWTTLYILMGLAAYLIWQKKTKETKSLLYLFWSHLAVNVCWSYIFFGLKNLQLSLFWIIFLLFLIAVLTYKYLKIQKTASLLMVPYLAWVSFAAFLNYEILILNIH